MIIPIVLLACTQPRDDVLRMGLASAPINLDPRFATDATSTRINRLLYNRLVEFDAFSRPVPSLADWQVLSPRHYRFVLSEQAPDFSNGARLSAQDVKATYEFVLDPANASPHRNIFSMIERIEAPAEDSVDFFLKRPDVLFPAYLSIGILPAELISESHPFHTQPVGNGAFRFLSWPTEGHLRIQRRADGQELVFLHVQDPTVRVLKLLRGEIDMLQNDLPPEMITYLRGRSEVKLERAPGSNFAYIGLNLQDEATGNPLVRRAIAHAIDREAIIRYAFGGAATPAQALFSPSHWAGASDLEPYAYAPEKAKALLRRAGYDEQRPLELVYKTSSDPFRVRLASIIQNQLADVGLEVSLRSYDWGTFYNDVKAGNFQLYSLAWVGIRTPDIFRYIFHSASIPPEGANRGRFNSPAIDRLIESAETAQRIETKKRRYQELAKALLSELPYVPLWYEDHVFASSRNLTGYSLAGDGNYDGLISVRKLDRRLAASVF